MGTKVPDTAYPYPPHPGQPSGVDTFYPGHLYTVVASGPFGGHATLTDGLVSVWELSADGSDLVGSNTLTNNNGVTFVAKGAGAPANLPGTVANFVAASNQSFSTTAGINDSAGFTYSLWVNTVNAGSSELLSKWENNSKAEFRLQAPDGFTRPQFGLLDGVNPGNTQNAYWGTDPGENVWYNVVIWYNGTNEMGIAVNNGTPVTSSVTFAGAPNTGSKFELGAWSFVGSYLTGKLSSVVRWSRVLTADERADLYASGDGLFY